MIKTQWIFIFLILSTPTHATSLIINESPDGVQSQLYLQENKARIDDPNSPDTYMLMNSQTNTLVQLYKKSKVAIVMNINKELELASSSMPDSATTNANLVHKGKGPVIAGYDTQKYKVYAKNEDCGSIYVSKKAMQELGDNAYIQFMDTMAALQGKHIKKTRQTASPCHDFQPNYSKIYNSIGYPMKIHGIKDRLVSKVNKITHNIKKPISLEIPADYKTLTKEQLKKAMMSRSAK